VSRLVLLRRRWERSLTSSRTLRPVSSVVATLGLSLFVLAYGIGPMIISVSPENARSLSGHPTH
jgi:hypothetical protein